jgi:hypothetical protein
METLVYYNPHPQNKRVGDCVKRAFTKALNMDYIEVKRYLNNIKNEIGAKKYNSNEVWKEVVVRHNMKKISFKAIAGESRMNGERFCKEYNKGTYLLRMSKHLVACVDGVIYDTWDCRNKCVYNAYKIN